MKSITSYAMAAGLVIGLIGSFGISLAQEKKGAAQPKVEQKGSQPAAQPAAKPAPLKRQVKTILDDKAELNLSEDQAKRISDYMNNLDKDYRVMKAKQQLVTVDLQNLLEKDGEFADIKKKIKESFDIQANMKISELETARNVNKVLSPEQLKKWRAIRASKGQ